MRSPAPSVTSSKPRWPPSVSKPVSTVPFRRATTCTPEPDPGAVVGGEPPLGVGDRDPAPALCVARLDLGDLAARGPRRLVAGAKQLRLALGGNLGGGRRRSPGAAACPPRSRALGSRRSPRVAAATAAAGPLQVALRPARRRARSSSSRRGSPGSRRRARRRAGRSRSATRRSKARSRRGPRRTARRTRRHGRARASTTRSARLRLDQRRRVVPGHQLVPPPAHRARSIRLGGGGEQPAAARGLGRVGRASPAQVVDARERLARRSAPAQEAGRLVRVGRDAAEDGALGFVASVATSRTKSRSTARMSKNISEASVKRSATATIASAFVANDERLPVLGRDVRVA